MASDNKINYFNSPKALILLSTSLSRISKENLDHYDLENIPKKPYIIKMQLAFPVFWYAINLKEIFQEESKIFRRKKKTLYINF